MTLKIERTQNKGGVVISLCGRMELEDAIEAEKFFELEGDEQGFVLDLKDVTLVDRDVVRLLATWEMRGIKLERCPSFLRVWLLRERAKQEPQ